MKTLRFALLTVLLLGLAQAEILRTRDARVSRVDLSGKENREALNSRVRDQRGFSGERHREVELGRRTFTRRLVRAAEEERQDKAELDRRVMDRRVSSDGEGRRMESRVRMERNLNAEERESRRMDNRQRSRSLDRREEQRRLVREENKERARSLERDERQERGRTMRVAREERVREERERVPLSRKEQVRQEIRTRMDDRRVSRVRTDDERREDERRLSLKDLERSEERRTFIVSRVRDMSPTPVAIGDKVEGTMGSGISSLIFGGAAAALMLMASGKGKKIAMD